LTAEGTTSKGTGSISCEVEFCIFYRLSLGTLRTNDVDALTYIVLSKATKRMPYGESVVSTECITL
jgi:hypothetical protein